MEKKRLLINLLSNMISFILQMGISFILTPIIVEKVGDAAYGFIGLANNFVNYASIFSIIINSMASRFITLELGKGNIDTANKYYSSVFILDIVISFITAMISIFIVFNLNEILNIPMNLDSDVKVTFTLVFANFILSLITTVFSISTFAKNRLDIEAVKNIVGNVLRTICLVILFTFFLPKIYYISIAGLIYSIYSLLANIKITKKIAPELEVRKVYFDKQSVRQLIGSGIWNALNSLGKILLTGLDLLIANIFIGANEMGILAIAKTVPNAIESLLATIGSTFTPQFIMLYSKNRIKDLINSVNFSIKILGLIMIVPIAGFIVFGKEFFSLWLPLKAEYEIQQIQLLSILSLLPYVISANNFTLSALDTTTNKLKKPVIVTISMSLLSAVVTIVLLKTTGLGIYAIAGVSSVFWCLKVFFFNTINAARNLDVKWNVFYKQYIKNIIYFIIILIVLIILKHCMFINSWKTFLFAVTISGALGYIMVFCLLLKKEEKKYIYSLVKEKCNETNFKKN